MTPTEQSNYTRCFRRIKHGHRVRMYLDANYLSTTITDRISVAMEVVGFYLEGGVRTAMLIESDVGYGMASYEAKFGYIGNMRKNPVYVLSDRVGSHRYYQWICANQAGYGRIATVER